MKINLHQLNHADSGTIGYHSIIVILCSLLTYSLKHIRADSRVMSIGKNFTSGKDLHNRVGERMTSRVNENIGDKLSQAVENDKH